MKPEDRQRLKRFWIGKGLLLTGAIGGMAIGITRIPTLYDTFSHEIEFSSYEPVATELLRELPRTKVGTAINEIEESKKFFLNVGNKIAFPILLKALSSERFIAVLLLFFGLSVVSSACLSFAYDLRNPYPLSWSGHLLLPEEMIAELIALKRRCQKQNLPQWKLLLELTVEVLLLLWAIHIQVRFQNLNLPPSKKSNID